MADEEPTAVPSRRRLEEEPSPSKRSKITWDEETIALHDLDRGTRMKIDEPNTPYHSYQQPDGAIEEDMRNSGSMPALELDPKSPAHHEPSGKPELKEQWDELHSKLSKEKEKRETTDATTKNIRAKTQWDTDSDEDMKEAGESSDEKHQMFEQKRKNHYNEFEMMRKWKMEHANDDEDDIDNAKA